MLVAKETLVELVEEKQSGKFKVVQIRLQNDGQWLSLWRMIFTDGHKFYESFYERTKPNTTDFGPYHQSPEMIECEEVIPTESIITTYVTKPKDKTDLALDTLYGAEPQ